MAGLSWLACRPDRGWLAGRLGRLQFHWSLAAWLGAGLAAKLAAVQVESGRTKPRTKAASRAAGAVSSDIKLSEVHLGDICSAQQLQTILRHDTASTALVMKYS